MVSVAEETQANVAATQDVSDDDLLKLVEEGAEEGVTEPASEGTEPKADQEKKDEGAAVLAELLGESDIEAVRKAAREEGRREGETAAQQLQREQGERDAESNRILGIDQAFRGRAQGIRNFLEERIDTRLTENDIERVVATFNEHHAQLEPVIGLSYGRALRQALISHLPEAERQPFLEKLASEPDLGKLMGAFKDILATGARQGYRSESDYLAATVQGKKAVLRDLLTHPEKLEALLSKARGIKGVPAGAGASGGLPTWAQWQTMTLEQREEGRKRDPQIEVKMITAGGQA